MSEETKNETAAAAEAAEPKVEAAAEVKAEAKVEAKKPALTGKVKWFSNVKGYGFIVGEGDKDVFVHYSAISKEGYKRLKGGEEVSYELAENKKGVQAANVVKGKKAEPAKK